VSFFVLVKDYIWMEFRIMIWVDISFGNFRQLSLVSAASSPVF